MSYLLAIAYHYVLDDGNNEYFQGLKGLSRAEFVSQLDLLGNRYDFIAPEDLDRKPWEDGRPRCLVTFDDGTKDHLNVVAPILSERGVKGLFFVATGILTGEFCIAAHLLHQLLRFFGADKIAAEVNSVARDTGVPLSIDLTLTQNYYPYDEPRTATLKYQLNHIADATFARNVLTIVYERLRGSSEEFRSAFYLDVADARTIEAGGHMVSAHSHGHINLAASPRAEMRGDVASARSALDRFGLVHGHAHFAVPFGGAGTFDNEVLSELRDKGFRHTHVSGAILNRSCEGLVYRYGAKNIPPFAETWPA